MSRGVVQLVGCGPGGSDWVLPAAHRAVEGSDVVFGPADLQGLFPRAPGARLEIPFRPEAAAPLVEAALARGLSCAVLLRGDCGLHSLAKGLQERLPAGSCRRVPGLSSVQAACAAFGLDWERVRVASLHGRSGAGLTDSDKEAPVIAILGGGPGFGDVVSRMALELGRPAYVGCDLTLPGERLHWPVPGGQLPSDLPSRSVALLGKEIA